MEELENMKVFVLY